MFDVECGWMFVELNSELPSNANLLLINETKGDQLLYTCFAITLLS